MKGNFDDSSYKFRSCGPIQTRLNENAYTLNENGILDVYISDYELDILILIATESYSKNSKVAEISFQGIKNKLQIHQQKITTALKRLINKGMIEKTLNGYSLKKKGLKTIDKILKSDTCLNNNCKEYFGLEISIPLNKKHKNNNFFKLIYLLKGRWFSHWRYIGLFSNPSSIKMEWQSLSGDLEACLCVSEKSFCIAIFDKTSNQTNLNLALLEDEFNEFLIKIQKIMNINLIENQPVSKFKIITHSSCDKLKMRNFISTYT